MRNAFHQAAIAQQHPSSVVDDVVSGAVKALRQKLFCERKANRVRQTLTERAGGGFDSGRFKGFRMAGSFRVQLPKALDLLNRQVVPGQMQQCVLQH